MNTKPMFYLLIALTPQNCMRSCNLWLYGATVFYWIMTLIPRAVVIDEANPLR
jgi:hypothetical protein